MTVLYDHQIFSSQRQGGVSRYFTELLKGCPAQGVRTELGWKYSINRHLKEWDSASSDWFPRVSFKGKAHITGWLNRSVSSRSLASGTWDVFHPTYYDPYFLPLLDERPFVVTIHDMTHELFPDGLSDRAFLSGRKRRLAEKASRVIAVSENTRQDVIRLLGVPPTKVTTIHHGNSFRPGFVVPESPRIDRPYWLYVGSREGYKNWAVVVEALVQRGDPSDCLVLVGGGPLSERERRLLDRACLSSKVISVSPSDAGLAGLYQSARALIYPSLYEGFGMPLLEAMAWGCPVVAARASCLPEVGGEAALYFDPTSPAALTEALLEASDSQRAMDLRARGLVRAAEFTWERAVKQTIAVYQDCQ